MLFPSFSRSLCLSSRSLYKNNFHFFFKCLFIFQVCQPGDEAIYRSLFKDPLSMGNFHRLTPEQQQKAKQMQAQILFSFCSFFEFLVYSRELQQKVKQMQAKILESQCTGNFCRKCTRRALNFCRKCNTRALEKKKEMSERVSIVVQETCEFW